MTSNNDLKNDVEWEKLFREHKILEQVDLRGQFIITSNQIKKYREPRLMTKCDHSSNLPSIFKAHNLTILPITRSKYLIARMQTYQELEFKDITPNQVDFPTDIESIKKNNIHTESVAIHCAYLCGIIDNIMGEESRPTISGRMSTETFEFRIKDAWKGKATVLINKSQCEIDGGFESRTKLAIIEAKMHAPNDFLVRQIYFPYRLWKSKVRKEIVPVYMVHSNDMFSFFIYKFEDPSDYNSLKLIEQKNYVFASEPITLSDIQSLPKGLHTVKEPNVPFPQANGFSRIIDLLGLLMEKDLSKEDITTNYDILEKGFDKRQTDYYTNAAIYLGLIEKYKDEEGELRFRMTSEGRKTMLEPQKEKRLALAKAILAHEVFGKAFDSYFKKTGKLKHHDIVKIMKSCRIYHVETDTTFYRRASTVRKWIDWIIGLQTD